MYFLRVWVVIIDSILYNIFSNLKDRVLDLSHQMAESGATPRRNVMRKMLAVFLLFVFYACNPPPVENAYRKESRYPSDLNVPVGLIVSEWAGKPRVMASSWLIYGGNGTLLSAKHFTDTFVNNIIELGANECKVFLNGRVYVCIVVRVPPLRDAVVLKILGSFDQVELPKPYKISTTKLKIGDKVFIQGFHPHPSKITKSNKVDGFGDQIVPILKNFYELREADLSRQREVVFDDLEGKRVKPDPDSIRKNPLLKDEEKKALLEVENDLYIKIHMARDHKLSFGGLSGGVALNEKGEAVGVITAQDIFRFEYDKQGFFIDPHSGERLEVFNKKKQLFNTIYITPIESIKDLYDYARQMK